MNRPSLCIAFASGTAEVVKKRLTFASQLFAAVHGLAWRRDSADVRLLYGLDPMFTTDIRLLAGYRLGEAAHSPRPYQCPELFLDGESSTFPSFHLTQEGRPDWLGEIFEWIGAEQEHRATKADRIGAIPFSATLPGLYDLDPEVPWAAVAMRGLAQEIRAVVPDVLDAGAPEPSLLVATHDLDFLPLARGDGLRRGIKNLLIALLVERSLRLSVSIVAHLGSFNQFDHVVDREGAEGIESAAYAIVTRGHRRDGNYDLDDARAVSLLHDLEARGLEIGSTAVMKAYWAQARFELSMLDFATPASSP